jgi:hypothetical protein
MRTSTPTLLACLLPLCAAHAQRCPADRLVQPPGLSGSFASHQMEIEGDHLMIADFAAYTFCSIPDPFTCSAGAVFAYRWEGGRWEQIQMIVPDDIGYFDAFGASMDVDGDRMLVCSANKGFDGRFGLLHDYRFDHGQGQWVEVGRVAAPGTGVPRDSFGTSLSFDGGLALVQQDDSIHRYVKGAEGWEYDGTFGAPDGMVGGAFGQHVVIREDWVFIAADLDSSATPPTRHGSVYVFRRHADDTLEFTQKLLPLGLGESPTWAFGHNIAYSGTTLAVSEQGASRDFENQGVVSLYELQDGLWTLSQELTHSDAGRQWYPRNFGNGLSMDRDTLVAGTSRHLVYNFSYVFGRGGDGVWREVAVLEPGDATPPGWFERGFGQGSAVQGDRLVVAASEEHITTYPHTRTGAAYAFDLSCEICDADLDADGTLTIFDFLTFFNLFDAGDAQADFDSDGELTIFDFLAYQTAFDVGCE